jgi:hypothetical protein
MSVDTCNPLRIVVDSLEKAVTIDGMTAFTMSGIKGGYRTGIDNIFNAVKIPLTVAAAFIAYAERGIARCGEHQYAGGAVGGAIKYGLTGQKVAVGALNNLAYEVINDNAEAYGADGYIGTAVSIMSIESADAALRGVSVKDGMLAGALVTGFIYGLYVPLSGFTDSLFFNTEEA